MAEHHQHASRESQPTQVYKHASHHSSHHSSHDAHHSAPDGHHSSHGSHHSSHHSSHGAVENEYAKPIKNPYAKPRENAYKKPEETAYEKNRGKALDDEAKRLGFEARLAMDSMDAAKQEYSKTQKDNHMMMTAILVITIVLAVVAAVIIAVMVFGGSDEGSLPDDSGVYNLFNINEYELKFEKVEGPYRSENGKVPGKKQKEVLNKDFDFVKEENEMNKTFKYINLDEAMECVICGFSDGKVYYHFVNQLSCVKDKQGHIVAQESATLTEDEDKDKEQKAFEKKLYDYVWKMEPEKGGVIFEFYTDSSVTVRATGKWESGTYAHLETLSHTVSDEATTHISSSKYSATVYNLNSEDLLLLVEENAGSENTVHILYKEQVLVGDSSIANFESAKDVIIDSDYFEQVVLRTTTASKWENDNRLKLETDTAGDYISTPSFNNYLLEFCSEKAASTDKVVMERFGEKHYQVTIITLGKENKPDIRYEIWDFNEQQQEQQE